MLWLSRTPLSPRNSALAWRQVIEVFKNRGVRLAASLLRAQCGAVRDVDLGARNDSRKSGQEVTGVTRSHLSGDCLRASLRCRGL